MGQLTYLQSLRESLYELLKQPEVYLLGEDIQEPYGGAFKVSKGLSDSFPMKLISTPMSEQAFTGLAVGMALAGLKPIVEIMFGDFITLSLDQILNHASKFCWGFDKKINLLIRTPMGGYRGYGPTHSQSLEKLYFGLPNVYVIAPSVVDDPGNLLTNSLDIGKPVLFIENKLDYTRKLFINSKNFNLYQLEIKGDSLFPLTSVSFIGENDEPLTLITYGGMVAPSIELQHQLYINNEIATRLICICSLSPLDFDTLFEMVKNDKFILTIEEGHIPFGFGDAILSQIYQRGYRNEALTIGARNQVIGAAEAYEKQTLPDFSIIENIIKSKLL
ncbi:MAG: transketolase C-terminal domain-containing protein [Bacteroidota bacterium]